MKYDTSGNIEDIYEPGSRGSVLKNKLGIKSKLEIDRIETDLLLEALDKFIDLYDSRHKFTALDI